MEISFNIMQRQAKLLEIGQNDSFEEVKEPLVEDLELGAAQVNLQDSPYDFDLQFKIEDYDFYNIEDEEFAAKIEQIPPNVQQSMNEIRNYLNEHVSQWDVVSSPRGTVQHQFNLPPTGFRTSNPAITYQHQQFQREQNEVKPLNPEQIDLIRRTGQFEIPSRLYPIPYLWQISQWVVKGSIHVKESLCHDLAISYQQLLFIRNRIIRPNKHNHQGCKTPDIVHGIYNILLVPLSLVSMIVGYRTMTRELTDDFVHYKLEKKRQRQLNDQVANLESTLFEYLSVMDSKDQSQNDTEKKRVLQLRAIVNRFERDIKPQLENAINDTYDDHLANDDKVFDRDEEETKELQEARSKINKECLELYKIDIDLTKHPEETKALAFRKVLTQLIQESQSLEQSLKTHLIELIQWQEIYEYHIEKYQADLGNERQIITDQVRRQHPIRCRIYEYLENEVDRLIHPIEIRLKQDMKEQIKTILQEKYPNQVKFYCLYLNFQQNYTTAFNQLHYKYFIKLQYPSIKFTVYSFQKQPKHTKIVTSL